MKRNDLTDKTAATAAEKENLNEIFMVSALNFFADETATNSVCTFIMILKASENVITKLWYGKQVIILGFLEGKRLLK